MMELPSTEGAMPSSGVTEPPGCAQNTQRQNPEAARSWIMGSRTQSVTLAEQLFTFACPLFAGMIILAPLNTFAEHFGCVVRHVDPNALTFLLFGYAVLI
jgi:hypothetical protein